MGHAAGSWPGGILAGMTDHTAVRHADPRVARVIQLFESLQRADVARLGEHYAADATFKDPFNDVRGLAAIQHVFDHLFDQLHGPRFVVTAAALEGDECFLTWHFLFRFHGQSSREQVVRGSTHFRFAPDGRIAMHRDYWDAAEELYEKLPWLGSLMRWIKRRVNA